MPGTDQRVTALSALALSMMMDGEPSVLFSPTERTANRHDHCEEGVKSREEQPFSAQF
jgi:hypothetical protein